MFSFWFSLHLLHRASPAAADGPTWSVAIELQAKLVDPRMSRVPVDSRCGRVC